VGENTKDMHSLVSGSALIAIGAWAAFAPPAIGGWDWDSQSTQFLLAIVPGVAAAIGGLFVLGQRSRLVSFGGIVALIAGLWFIAAPLAHAAFVGPQIGTGDSGESIRVFQWIVFFFAAGALLSFLSAYAAGFLRPLQFADEMATEPAMVSGRARVPLPQERPRRQRGVREPAGQQSGHAQGKRSPKSGS
jgi:hypothetical protein